ncbi:MAG: SIR2 family protein [Pyrinomonadaceae bacterium]
MLMVVKGKNHKTAFILGAGATRGAIRHVLVNHKRIKPPLNADFFKVAETYAKAKGARSVEMQRLTRLAKVFKDDIPLKKPEMETAFSLLYIAKDFPEIYKTGPGKKPAAGNRKEIEDFLRLTFDILRVLDSQACTKTKYDLLASKLGPDDTIISLNYDTLLDSALVRHGWEPRNGYGLPGGKKKIKWLPTTTDNQPDLRGVRLLKVHGSVNWFVRGSFGNLAKAFESKPVLVTGPRRNEKKGYIRQIVPPIVGKMFDHAHWRALWTQGFEELCSADILVVVGCSLIDTDFHLRALLSRVVRHRKKTGKKFRLAIFVADTKTRRKWQRTLKGSCKATKGYPRFERFLEKELKT